MLLPVKNSVAVRTKRYALLGGLFDSRIDLVHLCCQIVYRLLVGAYYVVEVDDRRVFRATVGAGLGGFEPEPPLALSGFTRCVSL